MNREKTVTISDLSAEKMGTWHGNVQRGTFMQMLRLKRHIFKEYNNTAVVRHFLMAPKQEREDWKCTSIFQTIVCCGTGALMLIIAGGINMNVAVYATVERLKLPMESHPQPQKVAWINSTSILVTKRCLVSIYCGQYNDFTWCDFIPMDVTHRIGSPFPLRLRCVS